MATFSRVLLSGTPFGGRVIPVAATATPGTLVHEAIAGTTNFDEIFLWAANVTNAPRKLTIEWGAVGDPGDHLVHQYSIPANSITLAVACGQTLNSTLDIRAYADAANAINLSGYVNRIMG